MRGGGALDGEHRLHRPAVLGLRCWACGAGPWAQRIRQPLSRNMRRSGEPAREGRAAPRVERARGALNNGARLTASYHGGTLFRREEEQALRQGGQ